MDEYDDFVVDVGPDDARCSCGWFVIADVFKEGWTALLTAEHIAASHSPIPYMLTRKAACL